MACAAEVEKVGAVESDGVEEVEEGSQFLFDCILIKRKKAAFAL